MTDVNDLTDVNVPDMTSDNPVDIHIGATKTGQVMTGLMHSPADARAMALAMLAAAQLIDGIATEQDLCERKHFFEQQYAVNREFRNTVKEDIRTVLELQFGPAVLRDYNEITTRILRKIFQRLIELSE